MGIVAVCVLASALALVWYAYSDVSAALRDELQERGIAIGTSFAMQSRDLILTDNQVALYKLIRDTRDADKDLIYAFVLDAAGNVLVHTFDEGFPTALLGVNQVPPEAPYQVQRLQTEHDTIQDVAMPIIGGKAGTARLGMSEATIRAAVTGHIRNILLWVALILVLGLSVAYGLASILTRPVCQLSAAARAIGKGDFKWKAPIWARDEVGDLGTAFNEMSNKLKHKDEIREQLLAKVINAQEDERKRIACELHDETSQALGSLMLGLQFVKDSTNSSTVTEKITELRALTVQTLDGVHRLAMELRPSLLDDHGLGAAIQGHIKEYSAKTNTNIDYDDSGFDNKRLPSEVEVTVYRIIQEALANVAKHAKANNVSVVLRNRCSSLVVVIEDDGEGFDVSNVVDSGDQRCLGILGMYERASLVGGKLAIESQPGHGTTIFLEVPLNSHGS